MLRRLAARALAIGVAAALVTGALAASAPGVVGAAGQDLYAASTATGTGDCSTAQDACTLDTALTQAVAGDTIYLVTPGSSDTYLSSAYEGYTVSTQGTSQTSQITIEPAPGVIAPTLNSMVGIGPEVYATITGVTITGSSWEGILNDGGYLTLNDSAIVANETAFGHDWNGYGGGIMNDGYLTVNNSTIADNTTSATGSYNAGILNQGLLTVTSSTIVGNEGYLGSAGIINQQTATITASIVAQNMDGAAETGVGNGVMTLANCIGAITDGGYNVADDATCGFSGTGNASGSVQSPLIAGIVSVISEYLGPSPNFTPVVALLPTPRALGYYSDSSTWVIAPTTSSPDPAVGLVPAALCPATDELGVARDAPCAAGAYEIGGTTTALAASPASSTYGESVTFTATVAALSAGAATPTGSVTFTDGSTTLCSDVALQGGNATCTTSAVGGTTPWYPTISPTAATFSLASGADHGAVPVTVTANGDTLTGITNGACALVPGSDYTVSGNVYTIQPSYLDTLSPGSATLDFNFSRGLNAHVATVSLALTVVNTAPSNTTISPSTTTFDLNPSGADHAAIPVTLTTNGDTLTGIINGAYTLVQGSDYTVSGSTVTIQPSYLDTLSPGSATLVFETSTSQLVLALTMVNTVVTATYSGDSGSSTSAGFSSSYATLSYSVARASTATALTSMPDPSSVGLLVTYTATVTPFVGSGLTGSVGFEDGGTSIAGCSAQSLSTSSPYQAICTIAYQTTAGSPHSVTAVYSGDANYAASTSPPISQTVSALDSTISPTTATFDLNPSGTNHAAIPVTVTLNGNTLTSIANGSHTLAQGTDYTVSGSVYTIQPSYLDTLAASATPVDLTFNFSAGSPATLALTVENTTPQNSTISPTSATFDLNPSGADHAPIPVTVTLSGNTLTGIANGGYTLVQDSDYTVSGSVYTIQPSYLDSLAASAVPYTLSFKFSAGSPATLALTVENTTPQNSTISPTSATFDLNPSGADHAPIPVTVTLSGNTLTGIANGGYTLVQDSDYTVSGSVYTIQPSYLDSLAASAVPYTLSFKFSAGSPATLDLTVENTASTVQSSSISPTSATFDLNPSGADHAPIPVTVTLSGNTLTGIANGGYTLVQDSDYTVSGSVYTIQPSYLDSLAASATPYTLTFDFSAGSPATLALTVENTTAVVQNSTLSPTSATFDLNPSDTMFNADVPVTLNLNGNALTGIRNGNAILTEGSDYTVSGASVTILRSYLDTLSIGTATLSFHFSAGSPATLALTVEDTASTVHVTGVSLSRSTDTVTAGGYDRLTVTVEPADATDQAVTWTSDTPSVATVDQNGLVTAVAPGTADITATAADGGKTATCAVTVQAASSTPITLSGSSPTVPVGNAPMNVVVPAGIEATLSAAVAVNGASATATLPQVTMAASTSEGAVGVTIPDGTEVTGPATWNGAINLPQVVPSDSVPVTAPSGYTANVSEAIELGLGNTALNFDRAVRILLAGQAGKDAGWVRSGVFTPISYQMGSDAASALGTNDDGYISVGNDLVIWTKHFTTFVAYTETAVRHVSGESTPVLTIATTSLAAGTAGQIYSQTVMTNGSGMPPYSFSVTSRSLPQGLALAAATGVLSGTPTTAGTYTFTVTVRDADNASASEAYTLTVDAASVTPPTVSLTDIAGNWAQAAIEKLVALGAIAGYPDGTFRPDARITRAQFVTVLVKALKLAPKTGPVFTDTQGDWAQSYIATAVAYGIASGYDASHFGPNRFVTREQMAAMAVRAANLSPSAGTLSFADAALVSPWAKGYVETAAKDGIVTGYPDGTFRPLASVSRAQAAAVIARILTLLR